MPPDRSFADLMTLLRAGDRDAARFIFQRYAQNLIALAGSRLNTLLRCKVDPEDVVQSVFRSFFRRNVDGHWDLDGWDSLWHLLTTITLCKCGHRIDYFQAACRDVHRELSSQPSADESAASWEAIARDPTPSEAAMLTETIEQLMQGLDGRERHILELTLQGQTIAQISAEESCSERTVERLLHRIRKRLERMRAANAAQT